MATPMDRIRNRQLELQRKAHAFREHRYLTGAEISAVHRNEAGKDRLAGMPVITHRQLAVLREMCNRHGRVTLDDRFYEMFKRHRRRQLRACAQALTRQARALSKLAKKYFYHPQIVIVEPQVARHYPVNGNLKRVSGRSAAR